MYLDSHARYRKSRKLEKPFFGPKCIKFSLYKIDKKLEDLSAHNLFKMCRFLSFLLLVELYPLEFHPGPHLRSAEAGKRLDTRQ